MNALSKPQRISALADRDVFLPFEGGDPTGVADCTAALLACAALRPFGGVIHLGPGNFKITSATQITLPDGVSIAGDSRYATTITFSNAGGGLKMGDGSTARDIKFARTAASTATPSIDIQDNAVSVIDCDFANYAVAIRVGQIGGSRPIRSIISGCGFSSPTTGAGTGAISLEKYSNATVVDCVIAGPSAGAQPDFGIRQFDGDTCFLSNINATLHGRGWYVAPPAANNIYATQVSNCVFDSASGVSAAEFAAAGGVYNTQVSNTWFGLSGASGCYVGTSGSGSVDGLTFTGCEFVDNGDSGLICAGPNVKNWSVTGGTSCGNTSYGIRAASATVKFTITGHRSGDMATRGPNGIGINVDTGAANEYVIANNNLRGNTTSGLFDGGTGVNKVIASNLT